jgi:phosphate starvation-inducible PhoH-like protein
VGIEEVTEKKIKLEGVDTLQLLGMKDANLQMIEDRFDADVIVRGDTILIRGQAEEVGQLEKIFKELIFILNKNGNLNAGDVDTVLDLVTMSGGATRHGSGAKAGRALPSDLEPEEFDSVVLFTKNEAVRARTPGQREYVRQVKKNDIVFAIGPAGTGKTYLAVAMAIASLKSREVTKIVLARPAVEAGESLGFLPGDLREKVDPYLRPLYDALEDMLPSEKLRGYIEKHTIEIVPLAYMRGRTLNTSFVILDEAQNASSMQMKMFLTRLGAASKAIVTGDITQIDLPDKTISGLVQIQEILKGIDGVSFVYFDRNDVVRHKLVKDIIDAYEKYHNGEKPM